MKNIDRVKACIDQTVKDWNKTTLSDIEKWSTEELMIWGMVKLALYILNFDDYNKIKKYIFDTYGYDVGGVTDEE